MKRFIRLNTGQVLDLNKVKLGYSSYVGAISGASVTNEYIGYGEKIIWVTDINALELQADDILELIEIKKDLLEFRTVVGNKIRTHMGFVKPKNEKQSILYKYQLDGAQCLKRHIKAVWFRIGNTFERIEVENNAK